MNEEYGLKEDNKLQTQKPLVSVVITSFNHEKYISDAIKSILQQDYENMEVIVVDDGSTDGSVEIIQKLSDSYGFNFIRKKNGGLVSTVNVGFALAKGEFIISHGSDDVSLPGRIRSQVAQLQQYPTAGYVTGNLRFIDTNGIAFGLLRERVTKGVLFNFNDFMFGRARSNVVTCMFRSAAIKQVLPLDESLLSEDFQLFMHITYAGFTCLVWEDDPVIDYRVHESSLSRTKLPTLMRAQLRMLDSYQEHPGYSVARRLTNAQLFSALVEKEKIAAFKMIFTGEVNFFSALGMRSLVKFLLPAKVSALLKKQS